MEHIILTGSNPLAVRLRAHSGGFERTEGGDGGADEVREAVR